MRPGAPSSLIRSDLSDPPLEGLFYATFEFEVFGLIRMVEIES